MKLSGRTDIAAPMAFVFDHFADFEGWERAAMRRGADVARTDKLTRPGPGMGWHLRFGYRGRERELQVMLKRLERPEHIVFAALGPIIEGGTTIELMELSAKRTRVIVQMEIKARTLGARIFLQSLKLAKSRVTAQFEKRLTQLARDVEAHHAAAAQG